MAWVSPRVKSAEPWVRGSTPTSQLTGRISSKARPSRRLPSSRMVARVMSFTMEPKTLLAHGVCSSRSSSGSLVEGLLADGLDGVLLLELTEGLHGLAELVGPLGAQGVLELVGPGVGRGLEGHLDHAALGDDLALQGDEFLDLGMGEIEGIEDDTLGQHRGAALDHGDGILGARDDEIELALGKLGEGREEDELAVHPTDAHARKRRVERDVLGGHQRHGGAGDAEHVG